MEDSHSTFKLSSLTLSVYLPTILFSVGEGAVVPIIPLFAKHLGASIAGAALVVAARNLGQVIFDLPAGVAVAKWGDKWAMVAGTAMIAFVAVGASLSPSPIVLGALVFIMGGGWAFWQLARLDYVTEIAPVHQRGRAMSMIGGMNRVGLIVGPIIGSGLAQQFGLSTAFLAQAVVGLLASATMFLNVQGPQPDVVLRKAAARSSKSLMAIFRENIHVFLTAGTAIVCLSLLRQARQVFLPLWGDSIGLNVAQIGAVVSISSFVDAAVFYPSGYVMDRHGRKWVGTSCLAVLGFGLLVLPLSHDFLSFSGIAVITGFGNGLGSGIQMTLGADFAPAAVRSQFLGMWRLVGDAGSTIGPLIISLLTSVASLGVASVATAMTGIGGAAIMYFFVQETLRHAPSILPADEVREVSGSP